MGLADKFKKRNKKGEPTELEKKIQLCRGYAKLWSDFFQYFADTPVCFNNRIATRPHSRFTHKTYMGCAGYVRLMKCKIKKEWSVFMLVDILLRLVCKNVGQVLIDP